MRPSIDGFVDAALLVGAINAGTISVSQSADVNDVRILRIDHDPADLARVLQPDVIPSCAAVNGFVDAVAGREVLTNVALAGSGINGFRIGGSHSQRADRGHRLAVKNRHPDNSGIGRFPDSAIDRAKIKGCRVARNAGHGHRAPAAERPNQAPFEPIHQFRRNRLGNRCDGEQQKKTRIDTAS